MDPFFKSQQHLRPKTYFIHFFTTSKADLEREFPRLKAALTPNGMLWISWPKKTSKVETDLEAKDVIKIGKKNGLTDMKVASIDNTWTAMKFMYSLKNRPFLA
ncbi:MAG TPA: hypothetical protein VFK94_03525 [Patescibacteria group bacterium]|nr:hypothetical protein [Patescibacteria group bacterium]